VKDNAGCCPTTIEAHASIKQQAEETASKAFSTINLKRLRSKDQLVAILAPQTQWLWATNQ